MAAKLERALATMGVTTTPTNIESLVKLRNLLTHGHGTSVESQELGQALRDVERLCREVIRSYSDHASCVKQAPDE